MLKFVIINKRCNSVSTHGTALVEFKSSFKTLTTTSDIASGVSGI